VDAEELTGSDSFESALGEPKEVSEVEEKVIYAEGQPAGETVIAEGHRTSEHVRSESDGHRPCSAHSDRQQSSALSNASSSSSSCYLIDDEISDQPQLITGGGGGGTYFSQSDNNKRGQFNN
jgi:hypothetical protein